MFKFDKNQHNKNFLYTLIFLSFSLMNIILAFYIKDIYIFLTRETVMCFLLLLHYIYSDELAALSKEDEQIRLILNKKYPVLRFEFPLTLAGGLSIFVFFSLSIYPDCTTICMLSLIIFCVYSVLAFYSVFCVLRTPETRDFYNIKRSISQHGIWSFYTFSKVFHVCKLCAKVGGLGLVCTWAMPKVFHGDIMHRGDLLNFIAYPYTGKKANSDWDMMKAHELLNSYPEDRILILKKDGCTIDPSLLKKQMQARDVEFPLAGMEHLYRLNFWPFSREGK